MLDNIRILIFRCALYLLCVFKYQWWTFYTVYTLLLPH